MSKPALFEAVFRHQKEHRVSFHTPGHKCAEELCSINFCHLDVTELPDTDSLFEASGPILQAEQDTARVFGAKGAFYSAGGCTLCIQAMFRLCAPSGGKVICGRTIHRSALCAMALLGITPVWVWPVQDAGEGLPGRISPADVKRALKETPDAHGVYVTSPDYYGVMSDIGAISQTCREAGVPLMVDNAHGSHLKFVGGDMHPITLGADMAACSVHKTLPVLTGGAVLLINDERYLANAKDAMALFGSTSPSYPIMVSIDMMSHWAEDCAADAFAALTCEVFKLKQLALERGMSLPGGVCDPVRLTLNTARIGLKGHEAAEFLRKKGIDAEYSDGCHVVLLPTPFNRIGDFGRLGEALRGLPVSAPLPVSAALPPRPPVRCTPREAMLLPWETVSVKEAAGRVAAAVQCPCPPGVPVVMPGEEITPRGAEFFVKYGISVVKVLK